MLEDAAKKLSTDSASNAAKDPSLVILEQDVMHLLKLDCVLDCVKRICETKGDWRAGATSRHNTDTIRTELSPELSVYKYSTETVVEHMRTKVARLSKPELMEKSRTMTRNLAKDGLMDDGKEQLLEGMPFMD
jgi:ribonuclease H2 subunit B